MQGVKIEWDQEVRMVPGWTVNWGMALGPNKLPTLLL